LHIRQGYSEPPRFAPHDSKVQAFASRFFLKSFSSSRRLLWSGSLHTSSQSSTSIRQPPEIAGTIEGRNLPDHLEVVGARSGAKVEGDPSSVSHEFIIVSGAQQRSRDMGAALRSFAQKEAHMPVNPEARNQLQQEVSLKFTSAKEVHRALDVILQSAE